MDSTWGVIAGLVTWLDTRSTASGDTARMLRALKLCEELGEVAEALEHVTGTAPSGRFTWQDVHAELCDVIVTGMVAIASLSSSSSRSARRQAPA
ncbi:MazG-like family protein [Actinomadura syzygii]|uniref:NTP pyrophosphohydrolase MazG putative catalytic core domain-containing protein n=1 Tax=Actinomadura syzygii TaxID=1427538 RepID=A0A5D0TWA3_9ACTN|nr:MazG-like family protein [Actinomadura syzygii]TYC10024.1 hypothetical protein FXF65_33550 [Actinomadura syzygii]